MAVGGSSASFEGGPSAALGESGQTGAVKPSSTPLTSASGDLLAPTSSRRSITDLELAFAQNPDSELYIELCEAYLAKRRFMEAMVVCKKAIRSKPLDLKPKLLLTQVHEAQGRHARALEVVKELAQSHSNEAIVFVLIGRLSLELGQREAAIDALKQALDLEPAHPEATQLLDAQGVVYLEPSQPEEPLDFGSTTGVSAGEPQRSEGGSSRIPALPSDDLSSRSSTTGDITQDATHLNSDLAPARSEIAVTYAMTPEEARSGIYRIAPQRLEGEDELERLAEAVASEQPSRGRPRTTIILFAVLLVLSVSILTLRFSNKATTEAIDRLSREAVEASNRDLYASYKDAANALEEVVNQHAPRQPQSLARLAHIYAILVLEHLEEAVRPRLIEVLESAERYGPDEPETRAARGLLTLTEAGDQATVAGRALDLLAPYAASDQTVVPTSVDLALGVVELKLGNLERARKGLRRAADFLGNDIRARLWSARAAARAGRLATAKRAFQQIRKTEPRHPGAIAGLALVALARGELDASRHELDRFDELESAGSRDISPRDRALAIFAKSELLRRDGQEGAANVEYDTAVRLDPNNADFPFERGLGLLAQDKLDGAIEYLQAASTMEPSRWPFRVELAEAQMRAQLFDRAKENLDAAVERAPSELKVSLAKARFLRRTKASSAESYLVEVLPEKYPNAKVEIALELGRFYRASGDLDKAEVHLSEAVRGFGNRSQALQSEVLVSFGLVAKDAGRTREAAQAYRAASRRGNLNALVLLAALLEGGNRQERAEALEAGRKYLAAGKALRRTEFVSAIVRRLEGR